MRLTVLGCSGPYPAANGATSGYLVEDKDVSLLVDCGSGVLSNLVAMRDPAELTAVCLSHLHYDHACDLLPLQYYLMNMGVTLPVYIPGEDESPMRSMLEVPVYNVRGYEGAMTFGPITVKTMKTRHPVPCRALKFECDGKVLVYTGDAAEGESLVEFCRGADILLADGAFMEKQWHEKAPHMSAKRAAQLAKDAGVKQLLITHLPPSNVPQLLQDEARSVFPNSRTVRIGEIIE